MLLPRLFLPNTSPISLIGIDALMPVATVTIMLIDELQAPAAGGAGNVAPTGNAILVASASGAGAVEVHVADNGAMASRLVVYNVPAGNDCPDFSTVLTGIGA